MNNATHAHDGIRDGDDTSSAGIAGRARRRWRTLVACTIIALALIGLLSAWQAGRQADTQLRAQLLNHANAIAHALSNLRSMESMTFTAADLERPEFLEITAKLRSYAAASGVRGLYTFVLRDGQVVFGPEGYAANDPHATPPGTVYQRPPGPAFGDVLRTGKPHTHGPYTDEFGTFVSALAPVRDMQTGKTAMAVGVDIECEAWRVDVAQARRLPLQIILGFLALVLAGHLLATRLPGLLVGRRRGYAEAFLCAVLLLAMTFAAMHWAHTAEHRTQYDAFTSLAWAQSFGVTEGLRYIESRLDGLAHLFASSEHVSLAEFREFVKRQGRDMYAQAWLWLPRVPAANLAQFTAEAALEGLPGLSIWQRDADDARVLVDDTPGGVFHPALYIEPLPGHEAFLGRDIHSMPAWRSAIDRAYASSGAAIATESMTFASQEGRPAGVVILRTAASERQTGLVAVAMRLDRMIGALMYQVRNTEHGLIAALFQLPPDAPPKSLAASGPRHGTGLHMLMPAFAFGNAYALVVHPDERWLAAHPQRAHWRVGLPGLLFSGLLTTFIAFLLNRRVVLEQRIEQRTAELQAQRDNVQALLHAAPVGMLVFNEAARIVDGNRSAGAMFNLSQASMKRQACGDILHCLHRHAADRGCGHGTTCIECPLNTALRNVLGGGPGVHDREMDAELEVEGRATTRRLVFSVEPVTLDNRRHAVVALHDITERSVLERRREMATQILATLNRGDDIVRLVRDILQQIRDHTGIEAVGIRLCEGEDFPYFETNGLPPHFVELESHLCLHDETGKPLRDAEGRPLLACMCGTVLRGRTDPAQPCFTAHGSFWSNSTSALLAATTECDRQGHTRNRCNSAGYESVALIPVRSGDETVGLIQLNDARQNVFTLDAIAFFEGISASIGIAVTRQRTVEALRTSHLETRRLLDEAENSRRVLLSMMEDQKRTEEQRDLLEAQLMQSQKMEAVGRLAGGIAHDFNNMLQVIIGNTELALDNADPKSPLHRDLVEVLESARRSADLTRQLLAFARKQTITPKKLDLNDTVVGMLKILRRLIGEDISLVWKPGMDVWPVFIDPSQVDQIMANLAVNARDAIGGTGTLTIETGNVRLGSDWPGRQPDFVPGDYVALTVSDSGCGMDAETIEHAFEPFFTTKPLGQGTGLGLATVYGIVKQNNGITHVYSEPGYGTAIRIYLPRFDKPAGETVTPAPNLPQYGSETILLVEDELPILKLAERILVHYGYTVLAVNDSAAALRLAEEYTKPIHILVTDVVMPGMSGKELQTRLLALRPDVRTLYVSGYTAAIIAQRGIIEEGMDFLQKPFTATVLAQKVREILDRHPHGIAGGG